MLKIGITGNIGSGKTTVSKVFEVLGIPVFYADYHAKLVMTTDTKLRKELLATFGTETYSADGNLNRKYLADIVFNHDEELRKLNALVHPAVFRAFEKWTAQQTNAPYVLKEAALLFESGSGKHCDYTIMITAPIADRIGRVMQRDSITAAEAESRNNKQMSETDKAQLADFVIANDNSRLIIPQILNLHRRFLSDNAL